MELTYKNPGLVLHTPTEGGKVHWKSPSNLAIVKYWGKYGRQLPQNPSISLTLKNAYTDTVVDYEAKSGRGISLDFKFEGQSNDAFKAKMVKFLESIDDIFPFLHQLHFKIASHNSFPHSSGIASSASSMNALALCLCDIENQLFGTLSNPAEFHQKVSYIARLGSGSASRSNYPVTAMWGTLESTPAASNLYAIPFADNTHEVFHTFQDSILIANKGEKAVSSRAGHALMDGNIYAQNRYEQARNRVNDLIDILKTGDVEAFGELAEDEALTLHALMMCSKPSYMLMKPETLSMIERIRAYRQETKLPVYFSLDAGPNIHLLYPESIKPQVLEFINDQLLELCQNGEWIADCVGQGAEKVND